MRFHVAQKYSSISFPLHLSLSLSLSLSPSFYLFFCFPSPPSLLFPIVVFCAFFLEHKSREELLKNRKRRREKGMEKRNWRGKTTNPEQKKEEKNKQNHHLTLLLKHKYFRQAHSAQNGFLVKFSLFPFFLFLFILSIL